MGKKTAQQQTKEIKVVYVSNPVKFKATASEFRNLVQVLTGRDASDPIEDAAKFFAANAAEELPNIPISDDLDSDQTSATQKQDEDSEPKHVSVPGGGPPRAAGIFGDEDDVFDSQMMETINEFFPYSLLSESQMEMLLGMDTV